MGNKEAKQRYFDRVYAEAPMVQCACGCGTEIKSKDRYGRDKRFVNGHNGRKYQDPGQHKREWNHRNREARYETKRTWVRKRKAELISILGGGCSVCGLEYDGKNCAMFDFHHRQPNEKLFTLGTNNIGNYGWNKVLNEAKKCDVICANCHRMIHSGEY